MPSVRGHRVDPDLLIELLEAKIVVEFMDNETDSKYFALRPTARRLVFMLPEPIGITKEIEK